jgi:hypothetical protein
MMAYSFVQKCYAILIDVAAAVLVRSSVIQVGHCKDMWTQRSWFGKGKIAEEQNDIMEPERILQPLRNGVIHEGFTQVKI